MCDCNTCAKLKEQERRISLLPEEHREYFTAMAENLLDVEYDLQYYRALFGGNWPGAKEVFEQALKKINEKEK